MDADEPADLALDVVRQRVGVPQMPGVELDPECGAPDGLEQLDRLGDRGDHRPVLSADAVHRLETDSNAGQHGLLADRPKPLEDDVPRPIGVAVSGGPGQRRRRTRRARRSSLATSVPDPAPSPGPGQVLAPMWYSPSTGVR